MRKSLLALVATMIIPASLGIIRIYEWIARKDADVVIFYELENPFYRQPAPTRDFLLLISDLRERSTDFGRGFPGGDCLTNLATCAQSECEQCPEDKERSSIAKKGGKLLTPWTIDQPRTFYYDSLSLTLVNRGSSPAKEIRIILSHGAFFEIWSEDATTEPESVGNTKGVISIASLAPDEKKYVTLWSDQGSPVVRATFEGGRIPIDNGQIYRTGYNYAFAVSRDTATKVGVSAALVVIIIVVVVYRRKPRPPDNQKGSTSGGTPEIDAELLE